MSDIPEQVTEVVADAVDEVADQAHQMAEFVRSMNRVKVRYAALGAIFGAAGASIATYFITVRQVETKYLQLSEEKIEEMKQHYNDKLLAIEEQDKPDLAEIVKERGYGTPTPPDASPPMAVQPPRSFVEETEGDDEGDGTGDEMVSDPTPEEANETSRIFDHPDVIVHGEWDYQKELKRRSVDEPYVIHVDEQEDLGYPTVSYTFYEGDDVLANEREEIVSEADRERILGERNLGRFGHGSNDPSVVFIRNDSLGSVFEVVKSTGHYAAEVHGFDVDDPEVDELRHGDRRLRFDDEPSG